MFASATPRRIGRGGADVITDIVAAASPDLAARLAAAGRRVGVRTFGGRPGTSGGRGARAGPWSATPGTSRIRSSAHGLTDALRDAELLARAVVAVCRDGADGARGASPTTRRRRDELSAELFDVVDIIAGHRWTDDEIPGLLLRLSAAMADEVELLAGAGAARRRRSGRQPVALDVRGHRRGTDALGEVERLADERADRRRGLAAAAAGLGEEHELAHQEHRRLARPAGGDGARRRTTAAAPVSPTASAAWASAWSNGRFGHGPLDGDPAGVGPGDGEDVAAPSPASPTTSAASARSVTATDHG